MDRLVILQGRSGLAGQGERILDLTRQDGDVFGVNSTTLGRILSAAFLCLAVTGWACAHDDMEDVVSLGNDTYSLKKEAKTAFTRDTDKLAAQVRDIAARFCASKDKQLKVISVSGSVPKFSLGYASATIVFKALAAGDPALAETAASAQAPAQAAVPAPTMAPPPATAPAELPALSTDDLYAALVKLDDLRKKGILTDDEFQSEKKKLLARSR